MPIYRRKSSSARRGSRGRSKGRRPRSRVVAHRRRSYGKGRPTSAIQRGKFTSDTQFVKLTFSNVYTITTGGGIVSQVFRGNSVFDPDFTGAGHQPRGLDQWSPLYDSYLCYGSSIHLEYSTDSVAPIYCVSLPRLSDLVSPAVASAYGEVKYGKLTTLVQRGNGVVYTHRYMSTSKIFGVPSSTLRADQQYTASMAGDPVSTWFWTVGAQHADQTTFVEVFIRASVTYYCVLWHRRIPAQS